MICIDAETEYLTKLCNCREEQHSLNQGKLPKQGEEITFKSFQEGGGGVQ